MWPILKKKKKKLKSPTITYLSKNVDKLEISYIAYQNMNWWKPPRKVTCYELVGFRICIPQDSEILLLKKLLHSCAGRDERRCSRRPHGEPRCVRGRTGQGHEDEPDPCTARKLGELRAQLHRGGNAHTAHHEHRGPERTHAVRLFVRSTKPLQN